MAKDTKTTIDIAKTSQLQLGYLSEFLQECYEAKRKASMIWGPPGTAKSAHAQQFAAKLGLPYIDIRLAHFDPVDFKGIPHIETVRIDNKMMVPPEYVVETRDEKGNIVRNMKVTRFAPPELLPMTPAIICLEELPNALPSIQIIASRLLLDRSMDGGWKAHPDTMFIATGNRRGDRSGANALLMNLDNRVTHVEVLPDLEYWLDWLIANYSRNDHSKKAISQLVTFMKFAPQLSYSFDPNAGFTDAHAWPSYRTWHMVADFLESCYARGKDPAGIIGRACVAGSVGIGAAEQFFSFLEIQEQLPNVDELLNGKDKKSIEIPEKLDILYALLGAISYKTTPKNQNRVWDIVEQLEKKEKGEWSILLVRLATKFCEQFADNDRLRPFVMRHRYVLGLTLK